jgi:hypothetical protein
MHKLLFVIAGLALVGLALGVAFSSTPIDTRTAQSGLDSAPAYAAPEGVLAPYSGEGSVWVLDGGHVIVQVGRGLAVRSENHTLKYSYEAQYFDLALPSDELALLSADEGTTWRLSRRSNDAGTPRMCAIPVEPVQLKEGECGQRSLLDVSGEIDIDVNPETGVYSLAARDREGVERLLALFSLGANTEPSSDQPPASEADSSKCSAVCDHGNCNIQCGGTGVAAMCWCDGGGYPHCACVIPVPVVPAPEETPPAQ